MIKKLSLMIVVLFCMVSVANATFYDTDSLTDTGAEYLTLADNSNSITMAISIFDDSDINYLRMGIYAFDYSYTVLVLGNTLTAHNAGFSVNHGEITFDLDNLTATNFYPHSIPIFGKDYGIYFDWENSSGEGTEWYTHHLLNGGLDLDEFKVYDVRGLISSDPNMPYFDTLLECKYAQIAIRNNTSSAAPVPEPATCILLGMGMIGMLIGKNKFINR